MTGQASGEPPVVDLMLASTLESVDEAEAQVIGMANRMGFPEDESYPLGMAVREAMVNAVVHGNRYSGHKRVHFRVEDKGDALSILIEDEGDGFDPDHVPDPLAEENLLRQSGRGILLIRAFVDEFELGRRQPAGMRLHLLKRRPVADEGLK